jgi:hypothetical protein
MAGNSRTTFAKRQKERARQEKKAEKAQKKAMRKQEKEGDAQPASPELVISHDEEGIPQGFDYHDFNH